MRSSNRIRREGNTIILPNDCVHDATETAYDLREKIENVQGTVVVDCQSLGILGSAIIGVMAQLHAKISLKNVSQEVREKLHIYKLDKILTIEEESGKEGTIA